MTEMWQFNIMEATISLDLNISHILSRIKPLEKRASSYLFVKNVLCFWELASSKSDPEANYSSPTQSLLT